MQTCCISFWWEQDIPYRRTTPLPSKLCGCCTFVVRGTQKTYRCATCLGRSRPIKQGRRTVDRGRLQQHAVPEVTSYCCAVLVAGGFFVQNLYHFLPAIIGGELFQLVPCLVRVLMRQWSMGVCTTCSVGYTSD